MTDDEKKKKRIQRFVTWHRKMLAAALVMVILLFDIINLLTPDREFSEAENRQLTQRPALTGENLKSGRYFREMDQYLADQFTGRDRWLSLNLGEKRVMGRKESGGVYLGKDGYLLAKPVKPDEKRVPETLQAMTDFAGAYPGIRMNLLLVPCAAAERPDLLPDFAPVRDQKKDIAEEMETLSGTGITCTDLSEVLAKDATDGDAAYYRTDHHWTTDGAYEAFLAARQNLGLPALSVTYETYSVSHSFQGTLSSQSGSHRVRDVIRVYAPGNLNTEYYVRYPDTGTESTSVYNRGKLKEKDQYQVFFGGNHPLVEIHTVNDQGRNLLIFKDSYANCFVPFLIPYYDNIYMVDPRYYYEDVSSLISSAAVTDVLFLYSQNTFAEDTGLASVLTDGVQNQNSTGTASAGDAAAK